jgi:hypothetical protein
MRGRWPGALVLITRNAPEPPVWLSATTDDHGRYRVDTLLAGRYSVALSHPILDTLELVLPSQAIEVGDGEHVHLDLALPSGTRLRGAACPGVTLPDSTGVLQGQVLNADTDEPLASAVVAVHWIDLFIDRTTLRAAGGDHTEGAPTNGEGRYRICGLPTGTWLDVQVQRAGHGGSVIRTAVPDTSGVAVLNLSYSVDDARTLAAADTTMQADTMPAPLRSGTASISGTVLGETGRPLSNVQLRVLETSATARTDSSGRYTLSALPGGTQLLEAKHIGYRIVQQPVSLYRGRNVEVAIKLQRIVSLDSVLIVARRSRYREFESQRKSGFGRYFTEDDIVKRHALDVSDLLRATPGFRIVGSGLDAKVTSSRGATSLSGRGCEVNIVIDGIQHQDINWLRPSDVGAMEVYAGPAGAPMQYAAACGLIVIWTRR